MEIDITRLSYIEFIDLLNNVTKLQNEADGGVSYISPAIREMSGQKPIYMMTYIIPVNDGMQVDLVRMKELAEKTSEYMVYVLRKTSGDLVGVLHLPEAISEECPHIKKIAYSEYN